MSSMPTVTVIDYGIGNILSVSRAFEHCGANVIVCDNAEKIEGADYLVLPGVGAFANGMSELTKRELIEPIKKFVAGGRPFLGICLGMQMMMDESEEFGSNEGLGLIPGKVVAIPSTGTNGAPHKIPHIGWNALVLPSGRESWEGTILQDIEQGEAVYFVHSFMAVPASPDHIVSYSLYNGIRVTATIGSGNIFGCQFHPEKSGEIGLKILRRFLA